MYFIVSFWNWIWKHSKQLEILLLISTVIFSYGAYCSSQEQLWVMREQLRSDQTFEKIKFLSEHYNWTFIQQPIYQDYIKNNNLWVTYKEVDMRSFIDEFEYVKTLRDILGYQDKTLWIFYRRILIESCKNGPIISLAKKESKGWFIGLCDVLDKMK